MTKPIYWLILDHLCRVFDLYSAGYLPTSILWRLFVHKNITQFSGWLTWYITLYLIICAESSTCTLLATCLSAACAPEVRSAALLFLSYLDEDAASRNDLDAVCASEARFPEVADRRAELAAALAALTDLLPALSKQAGMPALKYINIQNQACYTCTSGSVLSIKSSLLTPSSNYPMYTFL